MKNITKSLLVLLGIAAFSCNNDDIEDRPIIIPGDAPVLSAPEDGNAYVLMIEEAAEQAERFVWSSASFGEDVAIIYTAELDMAGNEFANPQVLGSVTGQNQLSVSVESLNGAAIAAGAEAFEVNAMEVRIKASVNDTFEPIYSNVSSISITPYVTYPYNDLYFTGTALPYGFENNSNNFPLFRDPANEDVYYYTGYFQAGEFKLLAKKGQWAPQYGTDGTNVVPRPTEDDPDPSAWQITTEGYYSFMVDLSNNTFTLEPYDAEEAPTYATIGIIGTATAGGWDADTDMTQSTFNPHLWYINNAAITAGGEMKFRANDAWM